MPIHPVFRSVDAVVVTCPAWIEWDSAGIDTHNSGEIRMGSNHELTGADLWSRMWSAMDVRACGCGGTRSGGGHHRSESRQVPDGFRKNFEPRLGGGGLIRWWLELNPQLHRHPTAESADRSTAQIPSEGSSRETAAVSDLRSQQTTDL